MANSISITQEELDAVLAKRKSNISGETDKIHKEVLDKFTEKEEEAHKNKNQEEPKIKLSQEELDRIFIE